MGVPVQGGDFIAARFHADAQGHGEVRTGALAPEEPEVFPHEVKVLGVSPPHPCRLHGGAAGE